MDRRISRETNYPSIFEKDEFLQCSACSKQEAIPDAYQLRCNHRLCLTCRKKQKKTDFTCPICEVKTEISSLKLPKRNLMNDIRNAVELRERDPKGYFANIRRSKNQRLSLGHLPHVREKPDDEILPRRSSLNLPHSSNITEEAERRKRKQAIICRQSQVKNSIVHPNQLNQDDKNNELKDDANEEDMMSDDDYAHDDKNCSALDENSLSDDESVISYCEDHKAKITFYCRPCNTVMCPTCRTDDHRGHRTRPIKSIIESRRQQIDESVNLFRVKTAAYFESQQRKVLRHGRLLDESSKHALDAIRKRGQELRSHIDYMEDILLKDVEEKERVSKQQLKQYSSALESEYTVAAHAINDANQILGSDSDVVVVQRCKEVLEALDFDLWKSSLNLPDIVEITFKSGDLDADKIHTGFGVCGAIQKGKTWSRSISICHHTNRLEQMNVEMIKKFKCIKKDHFENKAMWNMSVSSLADNTDNTITVCGSEDGEKSHLMTFDKNGRLLDDVFLEMLIDDIDKNNHNTATLSSFVSKSVKIMTEDGNLTGFRCFDVLRPRGVCLSSARDEGGFLICLVDEYATTVRSDGHRTVTLFDKDGEQLKVYEFSKSGERLFTRPYRVVENINGDICVVDKTSMGSGRIVGLSSKGDLRFVYEGKGSAVDRPFSPSAICCDSQGRLLVADINNSCIHILDMHGAFLGFLMEKSDGIVNPCAIRLSRDNTLWIAMDNCYLCCFRYNLA